MTYRPEPDHSLPIEKASRHAQRDMLADYFRANPGVEVDSATLRRMVGPNFQQRISDCRTELAMNIQCLKQWLVDENGKKLRRLEGHYQFLPYQVLGPSADTPREKRPAIQKDLPL